MVAGDSHWARRREGDEGAVYSDPEIRSSIEPGKALLNLAW